MGAQELGLNVSLLERLSNCPSARPMLLTVQYRMPPDLNAFPSSYFYGGAVRSDAAVASRDKGILEDPRGAKTPTPLLFWTAENSQGEQLSSIKTAESSARSRFNPAEAARALDLAKLLAARVGGAQVAVLSWYNAQVAKLSSLL